MQKHTKIYLKFFGYGDQDRIPCEVNGCIARGVDVHHLERRGMGGSKTKDYIENLVGLCRKHHDMAEADPVFNREVKRQHLLRIEFVWNYSRSETAKARMRP